MPTAPFLAPERDNAFKRGRAKGAGVTYYMVPGISFVATTTPAFIQHRDIYAPFFVDTPLVIDQAAIDVTVNQTGNARLGLYLADADWQPVGAPLLDSGDISTATTGVKTYTPGTPLYLPRGRYLSVVNTDAATPATVNGWRGAIVTTVSTTAFGNCVFRLSVGRTYAAFPSPGTAWDTIAVAATVGIAHYVLYRVSTP